MMLLLTARSSSYAQLITVLVIFCIVLGITAWVTKWMAANYQKQQRGNRNVEILETTRISGTKYIQLIRVGETCFTIAVCKDTVTLLGEVPVEQLKTSSDPQEEFDFRALLQKAVKKVDDSKGPKE